MALINCPECGAEVSDTAIDCPKCAVQLRKPQRSFFGKLVKWGFILFNVLMVMWMWGGMSGVSEQYNAAGSEAAQAGTAIGAGIGFFMILIIWALGDIILGLMFLFTRPKR